MVCLYEKTDNRDADPENCENNGRAKMIFSASPVRRVRTAISAKRSPKDRFRAVGAISQ